MGDCDVDSECYGDLVCGRNNCGEKFPSSDADCCTSSKLTLLIAG